jgi:hypothetical protein
MPTAPLVKATEFEPFDRSAKSFKTELPAGSHILGKRSTKDRITKG